MRTVTDSPAARLFIAQIRASDPSALRTVELALERNSGNIVKSAKELGIGERTLHRWMEEHPTLGRLRRGRIGRGPGKPKAPVPKVAKKRGRKAKA